MTEGSLVRKLPSYGRKCPGLRRHHVHVSSCQPHHHVQSQPPIIKELGRVTLRKRVNSQVKALSGAKPCVSSGKVRGCRDRRSRVFVSAGAGSEWVHFQKRRLANLHQAVARVRFRPKKKQKKTDGIRATGICQRCAGGGRFSATLLLCVFATGCGKTHWHGCARQSMRDHAATLLASGIAAGDC